MSTRTTCAAIVLPMIASFFFLNVSSATEASDLCISLNPLLPPLEFKEGTLDVHGEGVDYAICYNSVLNERVFYYSHGTVTSQAGVAEELMVESTPLPSLFAQTVGAFAWLERSNDGFSEINFAKEELRALRTEIEESEESIFSGATSYLIGVSQGANIVTHLIETDWQDFDGAGAVCGPIGNFWKQLQYQGDVLNLVDHYLGVSICKRIDKKNCEQDIHGKACPRVKGRPRLLRPDPLNPPWLKVVQVPTKVVSCVNEVGNAIQTIVENPDLAPDSAVANLLAAARLDKNNVYAGNPELVADEVAGIVVEAIRNHDDGVQTLGGPFYKNRFRKYRGSDNDHGLNDTIQRFNPFVLQAWVEVKQNYETSGELFKHLVAPHNGSFLTIKGQDPRVPFWHELLYQTKAFLNGSASYHTFLPPLPDYGHCNITLEQAQAAVGVLVCKVENLCN